MEENFIDCDPLEPILHEESTGRTFYNSLQVHDLRVSVASCVRIGLDEPDDAGDMFAFAQLLAIFQQDQNDDDEGVQVEVRWFLKAQEVSVLRKKRVVALPNELFESTVIDNIAAGAISGVITVIDFTAPTTELLPSTPVGGKKKRKQSDISANDTTNTMSLETEFVCRYLCTETQDTLVPIRVTDMSTRGAAYSEYSYAYSGEEARAVSGGGGSFLPTDTNDVYARAISQLHVSVLPAELPCRQDEQAKVYNFLKNALGGQLGVGKSASVSSRGPRPLYISGMPGTGKTATLHAAVNMLQNEAQKGLISAFDFIEINGLRIPSPNDAYTVLWRGMSGEHCACKTALGRLKSHFSSSEEETPRTYTICLLDELDYLVTANEGVVYNFFQWPHEPHSKFIVIGIANTMDLPERLSKRSLSRMGGQQMTRIAFGAYTHDQIFAILSNRLASLEGVFDKKSLELTARKAAAAAGDLRSALKICQRAIELHRENQTKLAIEKGIDRVVLTPVTMPMVAKAAAEYRENPLMAATAYACNLDKAILIGMCKYAKSTGISEMHIEEIWRRTTDAVVAYGQRASNGGLEMPPWTVFEQSLHRLVGEGMLVLVVNRFKKSSSSRSSNAVIATSGRLLNIDDALFEPRLIHSDIIAALRGVKDPMCLAAWPTS